MTTTTESNLENRSDNPAETPADESHNRPSYDDVNTPVVFLVGIISMILTFLSIWFVEGLFYHWKSGLVTKFNHDVTNPIQKDIIDGQKSKVEIGVPESNITPFKDVIPEVLLHFDNTRDDDSENADDQGAESVEDGHSDDDHKGDEH